MASERIPVPPPISTTVLPAILGARRSHSNSAVSSAITVRIGAERMLCRSAKAE
jgi:hypothetical protein